MGSIISSSTFHARVAEGKEDISNIRKAHNETAFADCQSRIEIPGVPVRGLLVGIPIKDQVEYAETNTEKDTCACTHTHTFTKYVSV